MFFLLPNSSRALQFILDTYVLQGGNVEGMKEKVEELISITQMSLTSFQLLEEIGDTLKVGGVDQHNPDESYQLPATRGDRGYTQGRRS